METTIPHPSHMSRQEINDEIDLIEENIEECGYQSAYAVRVRSRLSALISESLARGDRA